MSGNKSKVNTHIVEDHRFTKSTYLAEKVVTYGVVRGL